MADSLHIDTHLKRAAEREMARRLVDVSSDAEDDLNAGKRQKTDKHKDQIGTFCLNLLVNGRS
jgi:hypothetical protein